jgi:ubiquinone/menaquinone biosynthesis C-methylase UbiE
VKYPSCGNSRPDYLVHIEQGFDQLAPAYDDLIASKGWPANSLLREGLDQLGCQPRSVLDLGAGTGATIDAILACTQPELIVAVDVSGSMLEQLKKRHANDSRLVIAGVAIEQYRYGNRHRCARFFPRRPEHY